MAKVNGLGGIFFKSRDTAALATWYATHLGLDVAEWGGVLGLTYAMLYGLIAAEQYALLIGALVLLVMVALMMYLTRCIDWYAYVPMTPGPTTASAASSGPPAAIMERS